MPKPPRHPLLRFFLMCHSLLLPSEHLPLTEFVYLSEKLHKKFRIHVSCSSKNLEQCLEHQRETECFYDKIWPLFIGLSCSAYPSHFYNVLLHTKYTIYICASPQPQCKLLEITNVFFHLVPKRDFCSCQLLVNSIEGKQKRKNLKNSNCVGFISKIKQRGKKHRIWNDFKECSQSWQFPQKVTTFW